MTEDVRDAFFDEIYKFALTDRNVIIITADQGAHSLVKFQQDLPKQYINIGIAEQNLLNVGTGLALTGKKVYLYAIASFLIYRAFEQIKLHLSDGNLPVTLIGAGPGLLYGSDGPTHHAVYDIPIISLLPNFTIYNCRTSVQSQEAAEDTYKSKSPCYVRLINRNQPSTYGRYIDEYTDTPFVQSSLSRWK